MGTRNLRTETCTLQDAHVQLEHRSFEYEIRIHIYKKEIIQYNLINQKL